MSFTSQNYAVGKQKRMDRVLIDCLFLTTAVALVMGSASYIFGTQILGRQNGVDPGHHERHEEQRRTDGQQQAAMIFFNRHAAAYISGGGGGSTRAARRQGHSVLRP